jgi:hypothetical protein
VLRADSDWEEGVIWQLYRLAMQVAESHVGILTTLAREGRAVAEGTDTQMVGTADDDELTTTE